VNESGQGIVNEIYPGLALAENSGFYSRFGIPQLPQVEQLSR
jgi:hypothetical protein